MSRDLSAPEQRRLMLDSVRDYLEQLAEEGLEGLPSTAPRTAAPGPGAVGAKPAASAARPSAPDGAIGPRRRRFIARLNSTVERIALALSRPG